MSTLPAKPPRLLDQVRAVIRALHYSPRTEDAYVGWIRRYILFHDKRHPKDLGTAEVEAYLTHLATDGRVAASTQNQALGALLFLYRHVLRMPLDGATSAVRAKAPKRVPEVPNRDEVDKVLVAMARAPRLVAGLLFGSGLRLQEAISLRVKDLDFQRGEITVRSGKGAKDRVTMLPSRLQPALQEHLTQVRFGHDGDLAAGQGNAPLPYALARKLPGASREWPWPWPLG